MNIHPQKGILFIISAPSGAGKTSICKEIQSIFPDMSYSVSYTTRAKREAEKEGEDYHFIAFETFNKMIEEGQFLEWAQVHGNYYGTVKNFIYEKINYGYDCLLDIDIYGAKNLKRIFDDGVFIFIIPPSLSELKKRLSKRQTEDQEQIRLRTTMALSEIESLEEYQYLIINKEFTSAVEELKSIIIAERCKTERRKCQIKDILTH